ncbi:hypothetical protein RX330_22915 [Bradyrhizobium sp. NDS-1]|uniref:hypothetical protein n=1 Tax=Bradyrhizobium sp. NDS-1 TaxID=3080014 RepID=UPI00293EAFFD|nr:hypothetical protein [Bradyrhizobium sp. NDS-1]WOH71134.1 hypothetical protein RX330_22915 [Bradyrhizobium sp. NDS-1]
MKAKDRSNLETIVKTLLANIGLGMASGNERPIITVSLRAPKRKISRYDRKGFALLPRILEVLATKSDLIELRKSNQKGIASSFAPGASLTADMRRFRLAPEHFYWEAGIETIRLSKTRRNFAERTKTVELVDYADTPETVALRDQMSGLNDFLRAAKFTFKDDGGPPVLTTHRDLVRHFKVAEGEKPRFDLGGRMFNGWWQELPSSRRHAIRISGEPVADLDFSSAFLRLAHIKAGIEAPAGDLYARIPGIDAELYRDGIKQIVSAMLFRETPLTRTPSELKDKLPRGMTGAQIRSAVLAAYPRLSDVFESGAGLGLMFLESQIMLQALVRLAELDIPAMNMHDGLMVQRSKADVAARIMAEAAKKITGTTISIVLKSLY